MASYSQQATSESTFLYEGANTTNYGSNAELSLGRSAAGQIRRSLVRFPSLPNGVESVNSVILTLYSSAEALGTNRDVYVYRCIRNWVENQATWNVYSTGNNWGTAGCGNTTTDYENTSLGNTSVSSSIAANAAVAITLDNTLFLNYLANIATYAGGLFLKMYESGTDVWNPHSNDAATSGYRPKLTFNYFLGGGGVMFF